MNSWGRIGVFDLETTGVDVDTSRIVSACIAILDSVGTVLARWDWLADPGIEIPEGASAVHGITTERARLDGRLAALVIAEITQTLRVIDSLGMPVVVYNAPYDLTLLDRECRRHRLTPLGEPSAVIDPLVLDKAVDRYRKGKRTLEVTAALYGVSLDDAHDAGADAIAAGRVAQALAAAYPDDLDIPVRELHERQIGWYAEQAASFQDYIRRVKGDESYVAEDSWPMRPIDDIGALEDTMPFPRPEPRPSMTVPEIDLDTGRISIGGRPSISPALAAAPPPVATVRELEEAAGTLPPEAPPRDTRVPATTIQAGAAKRPTVLRVAAAIITEPSGRTLVVRKQGTTAFMQAGGKIEAGESALQALTRELREELGLEIDLDATEYLGSHRAVAANEPDTVIRAEVFAVTAIGEATIGNEIAELRWIAVDEVNSLELAPLTRETILPLWISRHSALF
jgi:DNA polymerase-3 subunit epsilon